MAVCAVASQASLSNQSKVCFVILVPNWIARPLRQHQLLAMCICTWDAMLQCYTRCNQAPLVCRCRSTGAYVGPAALCCNCTDMHCSTQAYAGMDTCGRPCSSMSCCGATLTKISRMLRASDRPWQSKQAICALTFTVVSVVTILEGASSCTGASSMSSSSSSASCPPASH